MGLWNPWYFPDPNGKISTNPMSAPAKSPDTNPNCLKYNAGDMERICTAAGKECIGWSKASDASKCYFYKDPTQFTTQGKDAIPHYSCTQIKDYPSIGGLKNGYLTDNKLHPVKAPS